MGKKRFASSQSGQVLLVVVLAAVISLTVGLSVASKVITNTRSNTEETNSQKALSAAEGGIEQSLKNNPNKTVVFDNGSSVTYRNTNYASQQILINQGDFVSSGADVWLSDFGNGATPTFANPRANMTMTIYWSGTCSGSSANNSAALEVIVLSGSKNDPAVTRNTYEPCPSANRASTNNFAGTVTPVATGGPIPGATFNFRTDAIAATGLIARIIPIYNSTKIGVVFNGYNTPPGPPSQGSVVESTGTAGNATKKLKVVQGYPKLPDEYYYSLLLPENNE